MLDISCPDYLREEISYVLSFVFDDRLQIPFKIIENKTDVISIARGDKTLVLDLSFFDQLNNSGSVNTSSMNSLPVWDTRDVSWSLSLVEDEIPVLFGHPSVEEKRNEISIHFDILGTIFFMLTRYEELDSQKLDQYGRFPANQSLAYKCNFLMRPIVDEYIEIIWAALKQLWTDLERKEEQFAIIPTHDVDRPFLNIELDNFLSLLRRLGGDILVRKSIIMMFRTFSGWLGYKIYGRLRYKSDPFDVFDKLLKLGQNYNIKSKFYFMPLKQTGGPLYGRYNVHDDSIRELIATIDEYGHEIGMHPTGDSYKDANAFKQQADALLSLRHELGIEGVVGGRQHYLLWSHKVTPLHWEEAGFDYDSTLSYVDHVGFRCGTCKPFHMWDFKNKKKLKLLQRPLVMMEGSLLSNTSMGASFEEAKKNISTLKQACKIVKGDFLFLWHNSSFINEPEWQLYEYCLQDN